MLRGRRIRIAAIAAGACAALAGCGGGSEQQTEPPYTTKTIRLGFVKPADLGKDAIAFEDDGHSAGHIVYTPADSVPTCPYVQRADDTQDVVQPALELEGGQPTGRFVVAARDAANPLPVVTQGAVVFANETLAAAAMRKLDAELAKCPATFTIIGGPSEVVGSYTTNSRAIELDGWKGYAQQLAHTAPADVDGEFYDDLETIVVLKANAVYYVGVEQSKRRGQKADSAAKAEAMLARTLARLG